MDIPERGDATVTTIGLGHDVVDVAVFAEQLAEPGSRMRALFSVRELRQAVERSRLKHDGEPVHLAAKWAGKEAVLKAWCEAMPAFSAARSMPYTIDDFPWSKIEILDDAIGVPHVVLADDVARELRLSLSAGGAGAIRWHVSLSHDGPVASAVAMLQVD
ncbi:4'-phosphopantetheinyl transferase superfamily protein [Bifidobacterium sp. 82T10]|uniref:Holo-[acyl-carrier-protein] synthase n=1 Tax=Bifidobacterium miconis TaxID=2834435 RepID=A0ABS6WEZ5_9BIFI|nr:4'-phosphopantetheinyl transferase superfamily protein [Bifidobacterium miconis]MBW3092623.1 4'-phosphopantetheinyl transferase superfamily protein [Bifidobacterium miconis]